MASPDVAPQLSPVRPFAPLDMSVPSAQEADIVKTTEKFRRTNIYGDEDTLESGAPQTPEEASLGSPSPAGRSPSNSRSTSRVSPHRSASDKAISRLSCVQEGNEELTDQQDGAVAEEVPGGAEQSATQKHRQTKSPFLPPVIQSHLDKERNFQEAIDIVEPKIINAPETVTKEDANLLQSREQRAHGAIEKGGIAAIAQSLAAKNEPVTQSHLDKQKNFQDAVDIVEPKVANEPGDVTKEDADLHNSRERRVDDIA